MRTSERLQLTCWLPTSTATHAKSRSPTLNDSKRWAKEIGEPLKKRLQKFFDFSAKDNTTCQPVGALRQANLPQRQHARWRRVLSTAQEKGGEEARLLEHFNGWTQVVRNTGRAGDGKPSPNWDDCHSNSIDVLLIPWAADEGGSCRNFSIEPAQIEAEKQKLEVDSRSRS